MNKLVLRFLKDNSGATAIEYGTHRRWHFDRDHRGRADRRHQFEHYVYQRIQRAVVRTVSNRVVAVWRMRQGSGIKSGALFFA